MRKIITILMVLAASQSLFAQNFVFVKKFPNVNFMQSLFGDCDMDGDQDLYHISSYTSTKLYRNDGYTNFTVQSTFPAMQHGNMALGDIDSDGDLDFVLTGIEMQENLYLGKKFYVYYTGSNSGLLSTGHAVPGFAYGSMDLADYDNDGDLDLAITGLVDDALGREQTLLAVYLNENGLFKNRVLSKYDEFQMDDRVKWVDYDLDGDMDLFAAGRHKNAGNSFVIFRNDKGLLNHVPVTFGSFIPWGIKEGDFDCDGDPDLLAFSGDAQIKILKNNGGAFAAYQSIQVPLNSLTADWADFDLDGDLDIIISGDGQSSGSVWYYTNNHGVFRGTRFNISGRHGRPAIADYDGDRVLDLFLTGDNCALFRNDLAGSANTRPVPPTSLSASTSSASVVLSWNNGTDTETPAPGLTYNIRVGTAPGLNDVVPSQALADGFLLTRTSGNVQQNLCWAIKGLQPGTYYWSVQTIDQGFLGSKFAREKSFTIFKQPPCEMELKRGGLTIRNKSDDVLSILSGQTLDIRYTIYNRGGSPLNLTGSPRVSVSGRSAKLLRAPATPVPPGQSTSFTIRILSQVSGSYDVVPVSISNDDHDENPYEFTIVPDCANPPPGHWMSKKGGDFLAERNGPETFTLDQNYPNPFNPGTVIRFGLPVETFVKLQIYNLHGQSLQTLVSQVLPAGRHQVRWTAEKIPSGAYLYVLEAGDYRTVKKMTLLK